MPRLHHLALRTRELDAVVAFYRGWFGFAIVRDERPRAVWLAIEPSAVLMIERADASEPAVPEGSRELVAFAISAAERATLREHLLREGRLEGETEHTLYFRDPDGRRVGASSYPL